MLFDLHPKESRDELFGRDEEVEYVKRQVRAGNWVVIGGQRGIGKTSLMKVVLNELSREGFRAIYINARGVTTLRDLLTILVNEVNRTRLRLRLNVSLNFIVGSAGITLSRGSRVFNSLLELLLSIDENTVIGLDEVQELSRVTGQFLRILGNVFMSNPRVSFIFTGSYVGLVKTLLKPNPESPLYGRPPVEVKLKPFNDELSREFLKRGFRELGIQFNAFDTVIDRLDGVVGWLTLFGNYHGVRGLDVDEALRETINEGVKIMVNEIEHFLEDKANKALYLAILSALRVVNRWKDIKFAVTTRLGREFGDRELLNALNALINYNFVVKVREGEYRLADPILREVDYDKLIKRYLRMDY
ncbi:AAA family ATPase [Vulcanisaeta distributa]|uniref:ATPase n=1 Tax=Vulcanisaeta distributa (strain DSM 14429 / JCM 11212 / NBRC 100878 / IC-017) TaxID=572478 RepID=E1QU33_VULDI|nr:ATP-binding protein [Vulcanisaeta distributa]ADN49830.1 ATPase [Vulcanisaeta distributa DSM 14429]